MQLTESGSWGVSFVENGEHGEKPFRSESFVLAVFGHKYKLPQQVAQCTDFQYALFVRKSSLPFTDRPFLLLAHCREPMVNWIVVIKASFPHCNPGHLRSGKQYTRSR